MGISLYGLTPATTYDALIKTGDNEPLTASLKVLSDGVGTNLPMEASTTAINFTGTAQVGGVGIANTTQVAAKQDTLVSGTNIKTINGTSVLGSGNIVTPTTSPSGVSGAIQFSNGSAFASDASNLFWDDTNNRLGVGTNAPNTALDISASLTSIFTLRNGATNFITTRSSGIGGVDTGLRIWENSNNFTLDLYGSGSYDHPQRHRFYIGGAAGERLLIGPTTAATIKGSGSTSATTSLLVQNSAGVEALKVTDDRVTAIYGLGVNAAATIGQINANLSSNFILSTPTNVNFKSGITDQSVFFLSATSSAIGINTTSPNASASFDIASTTKGFLPPRMTTTQKNAIASPATGLVVYDTTTNKLCCYNGSTWNDLF